MAESSEDELNFEQELATVERSLDELKTRYTQVQHDQHTRSQLLPRKDQLKRQLQQTPSPGLKAELKQVQAQLDELEFNLESRLFSWNSLKAPFWQILRFGGVGLILGWFLALASLNLQPQPQNLPQNLQAPR
jgi:chromosome segregation ATPase